MLQHDSARTVPFNPDILFRNEVAVSGFAMHVQRRFIGQANRQDNMVSLEDALRDAHMLRGRSRGGDPAFAGIGLTSLCFDPRPRAEGDSSMCASQPLTRMFRPTPSRG